MLEEIISTTKPVTARHCAQCGKSATKFYCSDKCKSRAYRRRHSTGTFPKAVSEASRQDAAVMQLERL